MSVSDTHIEHRHSYDTCRTRIREMSNSKSICYISDNSSTVLVRMDDFKLEGGELFKEGFRKLLKQE